MLNIIKQRSKIFLKITIFLKKKYKYTIFFFSRVSFGSSKGSMVETLVYETPVQEEPEINRFMDHNGRIPSMITSVPDTE